MQYSVAVRNAKNDVIETTIGTAPIVRLFNGTQPANCATADAGTKLTEDSLPSDWMSNSSSGVKSKTGTWTLNGLTGITTANAQYFRIYDSSATTCHQQGSVTATGGGGDWTMDNVSVAALQVVTVNTYSITSGNA